MNEMRHVLTGLKTPAKSSTLSSGIASAATATWYDVPMPIIVHCHEFHEEAERQDKSDKNDETRKNRKRPSEDEMGMRLVKENTTAKFLGRESPTRVWSSKDATSSRPGGLSLSLDSVGEVSRSETSRAETVAVAVAVASRSSRVCVSDNLQVNPAESRVNNRTRDEKRHSTTMELNATTTLKTDADGVPTISFSFLRAGENFHENDDENGDEIVILEVDTSDQADLSGNQLYDFPKSAILESSRASLKRPGRDKDQIISGESSNRATPVETSKSKQRGFYDLTRAHTQESGSITRVEEFGLSSVSEEVNVSDDIERPTSASPDSGNTSANDARRLRGNLRRKTASSDDILENNRTRLQLPGSFSMDKLCSRVTENDEMKVTTATATAPTPVVTMAMAGTSGDAEASRDYGGKSGLIKRRMLGSIRGLMASTHLLQTYESDEGGQGGFEDVRRYVKQGGDFCKELASILHERAELEATYAKGLSKLSSKLTKACAKDQVYQAYEASMRFIFSLFERIANKYPSMRERGARLGKIGGGNSNGGVNEAWRCVGEEMEAAAEAHRLWGIALSEQLAKPLRVGVAETQGRSRKSIENSVDKASKSLQEWRGVTAKSKKQSFACARENERLQDLARLQTIGQSQQSNNRSSSHQMTEKEASKLEARRRKAEDSSRRADTEFYTVSVRAERARLEYESTMRKGAKQMELLEEERLSALKDLANVYLTHLQALAPRLQQSVDRLLTPVRSCNVSQDLEILKNLVRRMDNHDVTNAEQLLPDFYAEHVTLAMNRERRKQALVRVLHLIRQDLERERRGREGLETLHRAFVKTPAFAADESTQNVTDKLHHMRSMLLYLEAARYKVGGTLAEVEGSKRSKHPLSEHILVSRDKQGLQQSVLKIPSWTKNESFEIQDSDDELEMHLTKDQNAETRDWADRTAGDGNSENPPDEDDFSDFDEFSSHSEDNNNQIDGTEVATAKTERTEQCRAIYQYSANLNDELSLSPGDLITVHQKQPDGWWIGECRGRTGIFPATYVQVIH
ncbi:Nostrin [Temnothorax longispinosus]|uniref:Nostrin n=1 Tax=Temnothorax longispinosus TaxID=300112 RepID=A0A4V3S6V1_9HYME|nr:Nostrin [Temnothorax longispinosus]